MLHTLNGGEGAAPSLAVKLDGVGHRFVLFRVVLPDTLGVKLQLHKSSGPGSLGEGGDFSPLVLHKNTVAPVDLQNHRVGIPCGRHRGVHRRVKVRAHIHVYPVTEGLFALPRPLLKGVPLVDFAPVGVHLFGFRGGRGGAQKLFRCGVPAPAPNAVFFLHLDNFGVFAALARYGQLYTGEVEVRGAGFLVGVRVPCNKGYFGNQIPFDGLLAGV